MLKPLVLTPQKITELWSHLKRFPQLFDDFVTPDEFGVHSVISLMTRPDAVWFEVCANASPEAKGVIFFTNVVPRLNANITVCFWDKALKGREALTLEAVRAVISSFDLARVTATIPAYNKAALKFAERLGATLEGRIRNSRLSRGEYHDVLIYSILKEELTWET